MPFDKKLACLTNHQERRSFPWPLVTYIRQWRVMLIVGDIVKQMVLTVPAFLAFRLTVISHSDILTLIQEIKLICSISTIFYINAYFYLLPEYLAELLNVCPCASSSSTRALPPHFRLRNHHGLPTNGSFPKAS